VSKILSQEEINALLSTVTSDHPQEEAQEGDQEVHPYDFKHPERISKDQVRTLRTIHEGFARMFGTYLSTTLRTMADIKLVSIEQVTYLEFTMAMSEPSCIYVLNFEQLKGRGVLEVSPGFVFLAVDRLFGGTGHVLEPTREVTVIEQNLLRKIVERGLAFLEEAWQHISPLEATIETIETNPQFVQIAPASETVVVIFFQINIRDLDFSMKLCFPYFVLEPVLKKLNIQGWMLLMQNKQAGGDTERIKQSLQRTRVPVTICLGREKVLVRDFMDLQVGDVIRLDRKMDEPLDVMVKDRPMFYAKPGRCGSRKAVKIVGMIEEEDRDE